LFLFVPQAVSLEHKKKGYGILKPGKKKTLAGQNTTQARKARKSTIQIAFGDGLS